MALTVQITAISLSSSDLKATRMTIKTPGVYIVEKDAFPNSVVRCATAVPAFIGYTEQAKNGSIDLHMTPKRISSFSEFESYFGGPPRWQYRLQKLAEAATSAAFQISKEDARDPLPPAVFAGPDRETLYQLVQVNPAFCLFAAMKLFFQNGGGRCYVTSIGRYAEAGSGTNADTAFDADKMLQAIEALKKEFEPTLLVIPETTRLARDEALKVQQAMLKHCGKDMRNRFAILDMFAGHLSPDDPAGDPVAAFREDVGLNDLSYGATYYPWLNSAILQAQDITFEAIEPASGADFAKLLKSSVDEDPMLVREIDKIVPSPAQEDDETPPTQSQSPGVAVDQDTPEQIDKVLRSTVPLYKTALDTITMRENCLPPGAAMAGIYAMIDNDRGVWKAPANVSFNSVVSPTISVSHDQQEDLNVPASGKSVNAIRAFEGEGTLVWGARTLDGNSLDWRYINVRRMMIMMETSIRLALQAYVFEPNTSNTWVTVRAMITNFLTDIWKQGGLAGADPSDAFSVHIGLGETMTPQDLLDGKLSLRVMLAVTRPAEFIELTISQQMGQSLQ